MRLLFDQNLSPRLVDSLIDVYPGASHVSLVGLDRATDEDVWDYAAANDCVIVSKDSDFSDTSVVRGFPPKIIWIRLGNCTTAQIERALRSSNEGIAAFVNDPDAGVLEVL
jgi:predicted nuclease of predicted toxin-antitoxin system